MSHYTCPNITTCRLMANPDLRVSADTIRAYEDRFCRNKEGYHHCKRHQVKLELGFCPDFVLPDSPEEIPGIIARFDETEEV
ncbi:MAG: hypothetical protein R6V49_05115 [Bacteroidales bacterium]